MAHTDTTDRYGDELDDDTQRLLYELKVDSDCLQVLVHDAECNRIGYWSKRSAIGFAELLILHENGYMPVYCGTREKPDTFGELKTRGYCEALPVDEAVSP